MSQWAEIRHPYLVEGVAKKQIARRLQLDIKTVRRAVEQPTPPVRASSPRVRSLDPWRKQIAQCAPRRIVARGCPVRRIGASANMLNGGRDRMRRLTDGARQQARSRLDITYQTPRVS